MAQFSQDINKIPGLRYIADALKLQSSIGRQNLLKQKMLFSSNEIKQHLDKVEEFVQLLQPQQLLSESLSSYRINENTDLLSSLKHAISEIRDINGTIQALHTGMALDDIGLFEIKRFALIIERITEILDKLKFSAVKFEDVTKVIAVLDPDKQRVPHFFVYDSYSEELTALRKEYHSLTKSILRKDYTDDPGRKQKDEDLNRVEEFRIKCSTVEDEIRRKLSLQLRGYSIILMENLSMVADLDLWLAKAVLAVESGLCKPKFAMANEETAYKGLFNPGISHTLQEKGKKFQPVDIVITNNPTLITGANMAGKTVVLKTIALAQYLFQYGFYVPATEALISPVDQVLTSMEDEQSELKGLSSFASEMLNINAIITASRTGSKILALIDEPARTTNPREGEALVSALLEILIKNNVSSLITTHYTISKPDCRRIRVAGLKTDQLHEVPGFDTLQDFMDYSLILVDDDEKSPVPHEALSIASILNIDKELLNIAGRYLGRQDI